MKFKVSAYTIWEQGPRPRQEDSIFPAHKGTTSDDRLFLVCDGMGGHSAGDVASSTVCAALSSSVLASCDAEGEFTDDIFEAALSAAYDALDSKDDGSPKKMGTTLTFLKLHKAGCTIAHIGDSRVYHLRPGADAASTEIVYQTQDHSLVNDLVRIGELTPEEAKTSKQRNVITRAMQPNMERRSRADIAHTSDIRKGDYFLLCSDGILEQMEDDNLKFIFSDMGGDAQHKVEMLIKVTAENHDNHSALLVHITDVETEAGDVLIAYEPPKGPRRKAAAAPIEVEELKVPVTPVAEPEPVGGGDDDRNHGDSSLALLKRYLLPALAVIVVGIAIYFVYSSTMSKEESKPKALPEATTKSSDEPKTPSQPENVEQTTEPTIYNVGDRYTENGINGLIYSISNDANGETLYIVDAALSAPVKWSEVEGKIEEPWMLASKSDVEKILVALPKDDTDMIGSLWFKDGKNNSYMYKDGTEVTLKTTSDKKSKECVVFKIAVVKNGELVKQAVEVEDTKTPAVSTPAKTKDDAKTTTTPSGESKTSTEPSVSTSSNNKPQQTDTGKKTEAQPDPKVSAGANPTDNNGAQTEVVTTDPVATNEPNTNTAKVENVTSDVPTETPEQGASQGGSTEQAGQAGQAEEETPTGTEGDTESK